MWVTQHNFSLNGVTDKVPIPHNSSTFCKYCCRTWAFFVRKHPIPHTHILFYFDFNIHITPTLTNFTPILCPHDSTQFFHFFKTPHSTPNSFRACYSTFWLSPPPLRGLNRHFRKMHKHKKPNIAIFKGGATIWAYLSCALKQWFLTLYHSS